MRSAVSTNCVEAWIERYRRIWEQNYERLDALLEEMKIQRGKRQHKKR
jgi:hypothetical protein